VVQTRGTKGFFLSKILILSVILALLGGHRIRHYGLFANANRADNIAKARTLLGADPPAADPQ
jgi:hypothetical protein